MFRPNIEISVSLAARDLQPIVVRFPAFTETGCDVIRDWVRDGGSLLLVADHAPTGSLKTIQVLKAPVDILIISVLSLDSLAMQILSTSLMEF
jgi:hypothetical protein